MNAAARVPGPLQDTCIHVQPFETIRIGATISPHLAHPEPNVATNGAVSHADFRHFPPDEDDHPRSRS